MSEIKPKKSGFRFKNPVLLSMEFVDFQQDTKINKDIMKNILENTILGVRDRAGVEQRCRHVEALIKIGDKKNTNNFPYYVSIEIGSEFFWDENIDDERAQRLLKLNAPTLLTSYIRPLLATLTAFSAYPLINLPFLDLRNIQELNEC